MDRPAEVEALVQLIRQMGEERAEKRGWKAAVARELGLDPSQVGKLLEDQREGVAVKTLDKVAAKSARFRQMRAAAKAPVPVKSVAAPAVPGGTTTEEQAANPRSWLSAYLRGVGFGDFGVRRDAVVARIAKAALRRAPEPELVEAMVEMYLDDEAQRGKAEPGSGPRRTVSELSKPRR